MTNQSSFRYLRARAVAPGDVLIATTSAPALDIVAGRRYLACGGGEFGVMFAADLWDTTLTVPWRAPLITLVDGEAVLRHFAREHGADDDWLVSTTPWPAYATKHTTPTQPRVARLLAALVRAVIHDLGYDTADLQRLHEDYWRTEPAYNPALCQVGFANLRRKLEAPELSPSAADLVLRILGCRVRDLTLAYDDHTGSLALVRTDPAEIAHYDTPRALALLPENDRSPDTPALWNGHPRLDTAFNVFDLAVDGTRMGPAERSKGTSVVAKRSAALGVFVELRSSLHPPEVFEIIRDTNTFCPSTIEPYKGVVCRTVWQTLSRDSKTYSGQPSRILESLGDAGRLTLTLTHTTSIEWRTGAYTSKTGEMIMTIHTDESEELLPSTDPLRTELTAQDLSAHALAMRVALFYE